MCSPFVRRYFVDESSSADEKRLRRWLRGLNIGRLEIKSRHLPIDHESLRRRLRLRGENEATLVFTRVAGRAIAILCRPDSHHG